MLVILSTAGASSVMEEYGKDSAFTSSFYHAMFTPPNNNTCRHNKVQFFKGIVNVEINGNYLPNSRT